MKKIVILLAVLIATPVFALSIGMTDNLDGTVTIGYSDANAANLPRAFALELTIDAPAVISAIGSYKADGESTSGSKGFGIYPARIVIDSNGDPTSYGTPLADPCDPGAGDGSSVVVLEFGSLYVGAPNAPATSGDLVELTINCNGGSGINLTMVDEDLYRGGVLLEDGTPVAVDQTIVTCSGAAPTCWDVAECPGQANGDANCDGTVNLDDLTALKKAWGMTTADVIGQGVGEYNCCADFNKTGVSEDSINLDDLTALKIGWGNSYPGSTGEQTCPPGH